MRTIEFRLHSKYGHGPLIDRIQGDHHAPHVGHTVMLTGLSHKVLAVEHEYTPVYGGLRDEGHLHKIIVSVEPQP